MTAFRLLAAAVAACSLAALAGWAAARTAAPDAASVRVDRGRDALRAALDAERALGASLAARAAEAASIEDRPSQFAALAALEEPGWGVAIVRGGSVEAWAGVLPAGIAGWSLDGDAGTWDSAAWSWLWFRRASGNAHAVAVRALRPRVPLRPELRRDAFPADAIAAAAGVSLRWEGSGARQDLGSGVTAVLEAPPPSRLLAEARRGPLVFARVAAGIAILLAWVLATAFFLRSPAGAPARHAALLGSLWGGRFAALHLGIPGALVEGPVFDPALYSTLRFLELASTAGDVALTSLVGAWHLAAVTARAERWPAPVGAAAPVAFAGVAWIFSEHLASVVRDASAAIDLLDPATVVPGGAAGALWLSIAAGALACLLAGRLAVIAGGEAISRALGGKWEIPARLAAVGICAVPLLSFSPVAALPVAAWLALHVPRRTVLPLVAVGGILAAAATSGLTLLRESDRAAHATLDDRGRDAAEWQDALYSDLAGELAAALDNLPADRPPAERDLLALWASSAAAREGLGVGVGWSDGANWWTFSVGMPEWDPRRLAASESTVPEPVALPGGLLLDHTAVTRRPGRPGLVLATVRARADGAPVPALRAAGPGTGTESLWRAGRWQPARLLPEPPKLEPGEDRWRTIEIGGEPHEVVFRRQAGIPEERIWAFSRPVHGAGESAIRLLRALVIFAVCGAAFAVFLALLALAARTIPAGWTGLLEVRLTVALVAVSAVPLIGVGLFARTLAVGPIDAARQKLDEEAAGISLQGLYAARGGQFSAVDDRAVANMEGLVGRDLLFYRNGQLQALGQPALRALDLVPGHVPGAAWREVALGEARAFRAEEGFGGSAASAGWYPSAVNRKFTLAVPEAHGPPPTAPGRAAALALGGCTLVALLLWPVSALVARRISGPVAALTRAAGKVEEGDLSARVEVTAEGEVADLVAAFNRMTEGLGRGRDALARAERERAWREMARQVAHEIKNPLTPLKLSLQNLRAAWRSQAPDFAAQLEESVDLTIGQIDVLARIATDFAQFAGRPRRTVVPLDLNALLRESLDLFRPTAAGIAFVEDLEDGLAPVSGDRAEMVRVFTNLVKNAVQAMPSGGMLTVTTRNDGPEVEIRIRDTGVGIPEDVRPRMFEPYFSTKSEGTGLGLGIVRRVLDDMAGRISFESEPGRGTVMILRMPAGGSPAGAGGTP